MFTGLVEDTATVGSITPGAGDIHRYTFAPASLDVADLSLGESVAIDGCCLTVVAVGDGTFSMEATPETLARTTLGDRQPGARVNVERALRVGDRLGGHLVTGHVDVTGTLRSLRPHGDASVAEFSFPEALAAHFVEKGSIAVDGVSLTVNGVGEGTFDVYLIPHTLEVTTLSDLSTGQRVNLETDLIGKYVVRSLAARGLAADAGGITMDLLEEHGFL